MELTVLMVSKDFKDSKERKETLPQMVSMDLSGMQEREVTLASMESTDLKVPKEFRETRECWVQLVSMVQTV